MPPCVVERSGAKRGGAAAIEDEAGIGIRIIGLLAGPALEEAPQVAGGEGEGGALAVNDAIDQASKTELRLKAQIANLEDADMAQAALELTSASIQQNASLQSRARMPRTSLFDFLG